MSQELMNTKEVADYLGIHEKQVYALIKTGNIPCTRATGKWIFPKKLIDQWIESDSQKGLKEAHARIERIEGALLAAGSNDPVLDILLTSLRESHDDFYIFTANTGSLGGLKALKEGHTDIAWTHLLDPQTGQYNIPFIQAEFPDKKMTIVNLFHREVGLLIASDNPLNLQTLEDLSKPGVRFINRQKEAGIRILSDYYLKKHSVDTASLNGYTNEAFTHLEVGLNILTGQADAGFGTVAVSKLLGLAFMPVTVESFDMVLSQNTFFHKGIQSFIAKLQSNEFQNKVKPLGNYDFRNSGKIIFSSP